MTRDSLWKKLTPLKQARPDFFPISALLIKEVYKFYHDKSFHFPVLLSLKLNDFKHGCGLFKNSLLKDLEYI